MKVKILCIVVNDECLDGSEAFAAVSCKSATVIVP
jgi:hypothetical protein